MLYANNKDADQPVHLRSLISIFVIRCLDTMMPLVSISEISSLYLVPVAAQTSLCPTWSETLEDMFSRDVDQLISGCYEGHSRKEPRRDKTNKLSVRPAKTQISLGICPV